MRKWLARKLLDLATWLDWETVFIVTMAREKPKKKRGRPLGRKDSVGGAVPKPKRGRPLGSKNKPKVQP